MGIGQHQARKSNETTEGSNKKYLKRFDLSNNEIKVSQGYFIGRIILSAKETRRIGMIKFLYDAEPKKEAGYSCFYVYSSDSDFQLNDIVTFQLKSYDLAEFTGVQDADLNKLNFPIAKPETLKRVKMDNDEIFDQDFISNKTAKEFFLKPKKENHNVIDLHNFSYHGDGTNHKEGHITPIMSKTFQGIETITNQINSKEYQLVSFKPEKGNSFLAAIRLKEPGLLHRKKVFIKNRFWIPNHLLIDNDVEGDIFYIDFSENHPSHIFENENPFFDHGI